MIANPATSTSTSNARLTSTDGFEGLSEDLEFKTLDAAFEELCEDHKDLQG